MRDRRQEDIDMEDPKDHGTKMTVLLTSKESQAWYQKIAGLATIVVIFIFAYVRSRMIPFTSANIDYVWAVKSMSPYDAMDSDVEDALQYMHMGMIELLPNGSLAIAFQASTEYYEGSAEQKLYWVTSSDDGATWTAPELLVSGGSMPVWSPVLHREGPRLHFFYSQSSPVCEYYDPSRDVQRLAPGGDIVAMHSDDSGATWSDPKIIYSYEEEDPGVPKVIANKLVVAEDGTWVLPFWREPGKTCPARPPPPPEDLPDLRPRPHGSAGVLVSADRGATWRMHGKLTHPATWLIESSVVALKRGALMQLFRTRAGYLYESFSEDGGKTWSRAAQTALLNPNSKAHMTRVPVFAAAPPAAAREGPPRPRDLDEPSQAGPLVVAFNLSQNKRSPLFVDVSYDEGDTWQHLAQLETDEGLQFAYPTTLVTADKIFTVYSVMQTDPEFRLVCHGMKVASFNRGKRI